MDINYLLWLQQFRESTNDFFSPFLIWMSDFVIGFWPIAAACMIYWVFDRNAGKRILAGFGFGTLINGFLKLTFRITRPWLRDSRIVPYGDSIRTATGYSFPSGHSTDATSLYGGMAWWQRKHNKAIAIILSIATLIVLFSRNYLGVHTPQDVLVGFAVTLISMFAVYFIEDWTDKDIRRDWIFMIAGILACIVLVIYYQCIEIQDVYDSTGALVVNSVKMKANSFEGIGFFSTFVICRFFERRYFHFDTELKQKDRFIICVFALIPLYWWIENIYSICEPFSMALGKFTMYSGIVLYVLIIVPFLMSKIKLPKWMKDENSNSAITAENVK